jgi:7-cyano-7-deazaguanine reductase
MTDLTRSPLGHATTYADAYDASLLYPVERAPQRAEIGVGAELPFHGIDLWTAYELSWLGPDGKPEVAIATLSVPAESPRLVESKSVKLYLTAFNQTRFDSASDVAATIARDMSNASGSDVDVALAPPDAFASLPHTELAGVSLDTLSVAFDRYEPEPKALAAAGPAVDEALVTRLFRSVCPVTGHPDYASVRIAYRGPAIDRAGLLRYLVSFRRHPGFHEHCIERIYVDIYERCRPEALSVYARFTRRGGIDINPYRSSVAGSLPVNARTARQ